MRWLDGIVNSTDMNESKQTLEDCERQGSPVCCSAWGHRIRHDLATELN